MRLPTPGSDKEEFTALRARAAALLQNEVKQAPASDLADRAWALLPYILDLGRVLLERVEKPRSFKQFATPKATRTGLAQFAARVRPYVIGGIMLGGAYAAFHIASRVRSGIVSRWTGRPTGRV